MHVPQLMKDFLLRSSLMTVGKIIGAIGRLILFRLLGSEGIGLYQMAYSYYGLMITVISGGFATALSLATAKNQHTGKQWFHFSLLLLAVLGGATGLFSYLGAPTIAKWMGIAELVRPIQLLAPAIVLVPVLSLMRGFLQGVQRYGAIAISELIEQVVRVISMVIFASLFLYAGLSEAVGGAILGAAAGAVVAFLFLLLPLSTSLSNVHPAPPSTASSLSVFLLSCMAIMGTRIILPFTDFLDSLLVPNRLVHAGYSDQEATRIFGEFFGIAATVVYVPTLITGSLSHIIMPRLTIAWDSFHSSEFLRKIKVGFHSVLLWGVSASFFLAVYANLLSTIVVGNDSLANVIQSLSLIPLISGLREFSTTVLWSMDMKRKPLIGLLLSTFVSTLVNLFVIGIPAFSKAGIVLGILSFEITSLAYNVWVLNRAISPRKFKLSVFRDIAICICFLLSLHLALIFLHSQLFHWNSPLLQQSVMGGTLILFIPPYLYVHLKYIQRQ
ncbi:oligosaccharide flippase family protein [Brevibacillus choshinensis]|uniref:Oligosaccharide flippase family protein n=1 Tax=Brevibacillus choshinensis TaxID=54911 RepID=A0ABX7FVI4_BRECH|nr:oligosaccharide flippase family protein [Brevibacillus choshinensis]QRG70261.1 oligosaccharide flippase family protein [Brevibacillus choshinensis]